MHVGFKFGGGVSGARRCAAMIQVRKGSSGSVGFQVPTDAWRWFSFGRDSGFHRWLGFRAPFVRLILTLAYITKRLSEEEEEKDVIWLEGRQPSLYTWRVEAYTPPTLSPFRLLLDWFAFFINLHRLSATVYRLLPPTTGFHWLRHLARSWAMTTGFHRLPPPCAPLGRDSIPLLSLELR